MQNKAINRIFELAHTEAVSNSYKVILVGDFLEGPTRSWSDLLKRIPMSKQNQLRALNDFQGINTEKLMDMYQRMDIHWLTIIDQDYPASLKQLYDPPILLFYRGNRSLLSNRPLLSIVGSRKADKYGKDVLDHLMPSWVGTYTICSGLAKGIDTMAHQSAIRLGGQTVAVIGSGLNQVYPTENEALQRNIGKEHLLISEYPPYAKPMRHHFPLRNRIIAGLSEGTIVVEAEMKSGSLITAQSALDNGKEVFCVPGSVLNPLSRGTNHLIQQGAHCLYEAELVHSILNQYL